MSLRAGAAVRDISPKKSLFLCGYPHVERNSTGVHDPLLASALCLRQGRRSVVFIALDLVGLSTTYALALRKAVGDSTKIPPSRILITCSHTHSGPVMSDLLSTNTDSIRTPPDAEYLEQVRTSVIAAAREAVERLQPAELAWTRARAEGAGGNRHDPTGTCDPEISLLSIRHAKTKQHLAVTVIYSMHPTVMHEDSKLVSSDFPHYVRCHLAEALGNSLVVTYHSGPCGNQSPRYFVKAQTFSEAERLGRKIGAAALTAVQAIPDSSYSRTTELEAARGTARVTFRKFRSVEKAEKLLRERVATFEKLKAENAPHGPVRTAECAVFGAEEALALAQAEASGIIREWRKPLSRAEVQVLRIGETFIAGLPGELFVEYGLAIKQQTNGRAFAVSLANGELQGYIVTPEADAAGGYEASNSFVRPETGARLVEKALALVGSLQ